MNITIFIGGLSGGGAERVVCNLSNYLSDKHSITILTMANDKPAYNLKNNVKRISLINEGESNNYLLKNIRRLIRFRKYIKKANEDVYIAMLPATINLMLLNKKIIDAPIIISERCDPQTRYESSKLRKWIMNKLYPNADGFVFQTEDAKKYYAEIIGDKGVVIPNAINSEFIREPYNGIRKKEIVSVGRFTEQKNFQMLIESFSKLSEKYLDFNLVIYGDGPLRKDLEKYIVELGLTNRIFFPGYVNDIESRLIDTSLFVLPSNYEGMPNALIEAMALGLPCISTDCPVGGPKYLIEDGVNGFLVPIGDTTLLTEKIDRILSDTKLANRIGFNSRNIVKMLSPDKIYELWNSFIVNTVNLK